MWYADIKTIDQTQRNDGTRIVTREDVEREIREGMDPALARQEFYCDPDAAAAGAIFGRQNARLLNIAPILMPTNNRIIRVAWGTHEEGIVAVAFQDNRVLAVHPFLEQNLTDCVQAITRRHPNAPLIHHAVNPDPQLFSSLDGYGVVNAPIATDQHMKFANVATMLNTCEATTTARDVLADFAMLYAPYRDSLDENDYLTYPAMANAIAVMQSAQLLAKDRPRRPLDYSRSDRGVI